MCQTDTVTLEDLPGEFQDQPIENGSNASLKDVILNDSNISLEDAERLIISSAIKSNNGNLTKTANHLGMAKSTLYLKLKKHGLDRNSKVVQS